MRFVACGLIAVFAVSCAFADDAPLLDAEIWNNGVDIYNAGDKTNAVDTLKPLLLSREFGPRVAEVLAAVAYDKACTPGEPQALEALEESAACAQMALRAKPDDERARRNFARAAAALPSLRETRHINDVLAAAQGKDPGAILKSSRDESRRLLEACATYRTNEASKAVAFADALSDRAEKLADTWIVVKEIIAQSVTNEEDAATIVMQVDSARDATAKAARELADMEGEAYASIASAEHDFTRFHKLAAMPPDALGEDLVAQSNAWQDVETVNGRPWQGEALDYTRAFRAKFPAWARQYEQQAQADTNKPPFSAEAQAEVSALSTQLEKIQLECIDDVLPPKQEEALDLIRRIQELLPKDNSGGGQAGAQGSPSGENNQEGEPQQQDENQEQSEAPAEARQEENPGQQEQQEDAGAKESPDKEDKEVEAILKKAQERADEHEAEKRARMRVSPLPPNERDW